MYTFDVLLHDIFQLSCLILVVSIVSFVQRFGVEDMFFQHMSFSECLLVFMLTLTLIFEFVVVFIIASRRGSLSLTVFYMVMLFS